MFKKGSSKEGGGKADDVDTIIGPSVKIEGDFTSNGNVIVGGIVSGKLTTTQHVRIEEGAKIIADVKAKEAVVAGEVSGNITIDGHLEILSNAKIDGDIKTGSISIQQGAQLNGTVQMSSQLTAATTKNDDNTVVHKQKTEDWFGEPDSP